MVDTLYIIVIVAIIYMIANPQYHIQGDTRVSKKKFATVKVKQISDTESKIRLTLSELLVVDENDITPLSKIQEDLGADSLDLVEFVMLLEEQFGITITDDQGAKIITVADAIRLVDRLSVLPQAV